jgi:hypothetical protein
MESCVIIGRCPEVSARAGHGFSPTTDQFKASIAFWILWLFRPEPSDLPLPRSHAVPQDWKDLLKTIFWIAMSIGTALLLARLCS